MARRPRRRKHSCDHLVDAAASQLPSAGKVGSASLAARRASLLVSCLHPEVNQCCAMICTASRPLYQKKYIPNGNPQTFAAKGMHTQHAFQKWVFDFGDIP